MWFSDFTKSARSHVKTAAGQLFPSKKAARKKGLRRRSLGRIETLEDRSLLAIITVTPVLGTYVVTGDSDGNHLMISASDPIGSNWAFTNLGAGLITQVPGTPDPITSMTVDFGDNIDSLTILGTTVADVFTWNGSTLSINGFNITLNATVETLRIEGGDGVDTISLTGTSASTALEVVGGAGIDVIVVNSSANDNLSAKAISIDGGDGALETITVNGGINAIGAAGNVTLANNVLLASSVHMSAAGNLSLLNPITGVNALAINAFGSITLPTSIGTAVNPLLSFSASAGLGNLQVSSIFASGIVTLSATNGSVADDGDAAVDVTCDTLVLTAKGSADLDTTITTLNTVSLSGVGTGLFITETNDLNVGSITALGLAVNLSAGGRITGSWISGGILTVNAVGEVDLSTSVTRLNATLTGAGPGLTVHGIGSLFVGSIVATGLPVKLTSDGTIADDGDAAVDVTADVLTVEALTLTVVGNVDLDTDINTLNATLAGAGLGLTINETNDLIVGNIVATGLAVTLSAVGTIKDDDPGVVDIVGTVLTLNALGEIDLDTTVTTLNATVTGAGAGLTIVETNNLIVGKVTAIGLPVSITASGSISDDGDTAEDVEANALMLSASGAVDLDTRLSTLNATLTGAGLGITINEANGLTVNNVVTSNGAVNITTAMGNLTVNSINAGSGISAGAVTLRANAGSILSDGGLDVVGGLLTLNAQGAVELDTTIEALDATLTGNALGITIRETNGLTISNLVTANGAVSITTAADHIIVNSINAGTATVNLTATAGGIVDDNDAAVDVTGSTLTLTAHHQIDLDTTIVSLSATVSASNTSITIRETNGLALNDVKTNRGDVDIATTTGNITVHSIDTVAAGFDGDITLKADNGSILENGDAGVDVVGGLLTLTAVGAVDLDTNLETLKATLTGAGLGLKIRETGGLLIRGITATSGATNVEITANGGIGGADAGAIDVIAPVLTLNAVGTVNLETTVETLNATLTGAGAGITIVQVGNPLTLGNVVTNGLRVDITAPSMTVNSLDAGTGFVTLFARFGSILGDAGLDVTAGDFRSVAVGTIDLDTKVALLEAYLTDPTLGLVIRETDGLTVNTVDTKHGAVNLRTENGDIVVNRLDAAEDGLAGNVTLSADNGRILKGPGTTINVFGDILTVNAVGEADFRTTITTLNATLTGAGAGLKIDEVFSLIIGKVDAGALAVTINAGDGIVDDGDAASDVIGGVLSLTAVGEVNLDTTVWTLNATLTGAGAGLTINQASQLLTLASVSTNGLAVDVNANVGIVVNIVDAGLGAVSLTTTNGRIIDSNGVFVVNVTGSLLTLAAATNLSLDTNALTLLSAINSTSGDLLIRNFGSLSVEHTLNNGGKTSISTQSGQLTVLNAVTKNRLMLITHDTAAAGDNVVVKGNVRSTLGPVNIFGGDNIDIEASATVRAESGVLSIRGDYENKDIGGGRIIVNGSIFGTGAFYPIIIWGNAEGESFEIRRHALAPLVVLGGLGNNRLHVETSDNADVVNIYSTQVDVFGKPLITYIHINELDITTNAGNDVVNINLPTSPNVPLPASVQLDAGSGDDRLTVNGTLGNDQIQVGSPTSFGAPSAAQFQVSNLENLNVFALSGNDTITNSASAAVLLDGGTDNDTITNNAASVSALLDGGEGDDTITNNANNFRKLDVFGRGGNDTITNNGSVSALLDGGTGDDTLTGGYNAALFDVIFGGDGVDMLFGRSGRDYLFPDHNYNFGSPIEFRRNGDFVDGGFDRDVLVPLVNTLLHGVDKVSRGVGDSSSDIVVGVGGLDLDAVSYLKAEFVAATEANIQKYLAEALAKLNSR